MSCEMHWYVLKNITGMTEYYHCHLCRQQVQLPPSPKDVICADRMHECHRESCYPCSCNQKSTSITLLVKSLFIEHHGSMRYLFSYFLGCLWNKLIFSTYLKKSSPLNQLAKGIQAVLSQIWEHREWVSSSHSRGCVDAWWWYTSHLGMVLCSIHSTSHFSSLGHLQRGWSEQ